MRGLRQGKTCRACVVQDGTLWGRGGVTFPNKITDLVKSRLKGQLFLTSFSGSMFIFVGS